MKHAQEYLLEKGIRPSAQRVAVMKYLLEHMTHPTVEEIYAGLEEEMPTLSKTTIYNTLSLFAEKGAINALTIDPKNVRYDAETDPHGHFRCRECGGIFDAHYLAEPLFANMEGFSIEETKLYLSGLCPNCKAKN